MIRIAICDDDKNIVEQIKRMLHKIAKQNCLEIETVAFYDGLDLEKNITFDEKYDLIYLDIGMKTKNGIETAKAIRKIDIKVLIIYVSGYKEYVEEMLEVEAFRFIGKPINEDKFENYFNKAYDRIRDCSAYFEFQYKREKFRRLIGDIIYFASAGRMIKIVLADGTIEQFNGKLNDVENKLKDSKVEFLRIHQSYLVSCHYIVSMSKTRVKLQNKEELNISEDRQKIVRQRYCLILGGEICD